MQIHDFFIEYACFFPPVFWQAEAIYYHFQSNSSCQWRRVNIGNSHFWYWVGQCQASITYLEYYWVWKWFIAGSIYIYDYQCFPAWDWLIMPKYEDDFWNGLFAEYTSVMTSYCFNCDFHFSIVKKGKGQREREK